MLPGQATSADEQASLTFGRVARTSRRTAKSYKRTTFLLRKQTCASGRTRRDSAQATVSLCWLTADFGGPTLQHDEPTRDFGATGVGVLPDDAEALTEDPRVGTEAPEVLPDDPDVLPDDPDILPEDLGVLTEDTAARTKDLRVGTEDPEVRTADC